MLSIAATNVMREILKQKMFVKKSVETDLILKTMNAMTETTTAGMDVLSFARWSLDGTVQEDEELVHLLARFLVWTFAWSFAATAETLECMNVMMGTMKTGTVVMRIVELNGVGNVTTEVQFKKTPVMRNAATDLTFSNILVTTEMCLC